MLLGSIYAITDPDLLPGERLLTGVEQALKGGVRTVQYRDKSAGTKLRAARGAELLTLCRAYGAKLIINDDVEVAGAIGADGVHLGQGDLSAAEARAQLGSSTIIGVTCHANLALAYKAVEEGASYVAFGRFFRSNTKPLAPPAPLELVSKARASIALPVVVIGGITLDNMAPLVRSGAHSLAVCQSLFGTAFIEQAARALQARYQAHAQLQKDD